MFYVDNVKARITAHMRQTFNKYQHFPQIWCLNSKKGLGKTNMALYLDLALSANQISMNFEVSDDRKWNLMLLWAAKDCKNITCLFQFINDDTSLGESVPTVSSDSCSCLTGVELDVVFYCCSPSDSRFNVL